MKHVLLLAIFTLIAIPVSAQNLERRVAQDIQKIKHIMADMKGYIKADTLRELLEKYQPLFENVEGFKSDHQHLHMYYVTKGEKLLEYTPTYDAYVFHDDLKKLKIKYKKVKSAKEYHTLHGELVKLRRKYKKNEVSSLKMLKIFKPEGEEFMKIGLGDIYRELGGLIINMDNYIEDFGKANNFNKEQMDSLRRDPAMYITAMTIHNSNRYKKSEEGLTNLEEQKSQLDNYKNRIGELTDSLGRQNVILTNNNLLLENMESEKQRALNSLQNIGNELENKNRRIIRENNKELHSLKWQADSLRAIVFSSTDSFVLKATELQKLEDVSKNLYEEIACLETEREKIIAEKAELSDKKETAENGRLIFLISTIVLLLGLLSYVLNGHWEVKKEHQRLLKEKRLLEKNIKYKEGFYEEYLRTSKAEFAIDREKLRNANEKLEKVNQQLKEKAKESKTMLRELNHRTKNNLQLISSVTGIKAMKIADEGGKKALLSLKKRIHAIGLIHEQMYKETFSDPTLPIDMKKFINELTDWLSGAFQYDVPVVVNKQVEDIIINADKAIPIGMITNEVITNAFKHAFVGHPAPQLEIEFKYKKNREYIYLIIKDNGNVLPENGKCEIEKNTGGLIVDLFTKELEGQYNYCKRDGSLCFWLKFPVKSKQYKKINGTKGVVALM